MPPLAETKQKPVDLHAAIVVRAEEKANLGLHLAGLLARVSFLSASYSIIVAIYIVVYLIRISDFLRHGFSTGLHNVVVVAENASSQLTLACSLIWGMLDEGLNYFRSMYVRATYMTDSGEGRTR